MRHLNIVPANKVGHNFSGSFPFKITNLAGSYFLQQVINHFSYPLGSVNLFAFFIYQGQVDPLLKIHFKFIAKCQLRIGKPGIIFLQYLADVNTLFLINATDRTSCQVISQFKMLLQRDPAELLFFYQVSGLPAVIGDIF